MTVDKLQSWITFIMSVWEDNSDLKAALPKASQTIGIEAAGAATEGDAPKTNWVVKTQNDYSETTEGHEWESNTAVYEWDEEEGDIGPEHPELESQLFGDPDKRDPQGIEFNK